MNRHKPHNAHARHCGNHTNASWPKVDDIRQRTAEIRANWSEAERAHRREMSQQYAVVWQSLVSA